MRTQVEARSIFNVVGIHKLFDRLLFIFYTHAHLIIEIFKISRYTPISTFSYFDSPLLYSKPTFYTW